MAEASNIKIPPNSKESEMIVLGCMLTSIGSLNIAADMLEENDFYYSEHRIIFDVLKSSFLQDKPADVHLVAEELKRREQLKTIGGVAYLTSLAQYAGTAAHIEEYTELVRAKSLLRRMIQSAQSVEKLAFDDPEDVTTTLDIAQQKFFQISQAANTAAGVQIRDLLSGSKSTSKLPYLKELQEKQEQYQTRGPDEGTTTGIPTHYNDLDKLINGLSPSNLMILAARPAMGKTALALNIAENVCFKNNLPVGIFSLEMTADQLLHRIICSQAEVESDKIRTGSINGGEFQRIVSAVGQMQKHTMIIDDSPGLKITDLRARARRMREAHGIEFLVIDYLQLLSGSGMSRNQENRQMEVSEISRLLKTLARELNIPILCLSQLSRKVEERAGHRPMMSDLRESGCLSGDAEIKDAETGKIYTIKELAERKVQTPIMVYGVDKDLKMGKHRMIKAFYSGKKTVYEMKTRTGRTIKASANHPFLKLEGWTRLDALSPGDRIGLPRNLNDNRASKNSSDELVLLAHLLGDGCILPSQPYHYTSADEENIETVCSTSKRLFNIQSRIVKQDNWFHVYLPSPYRLSRNKHHPITSWYNHLGIERVRSYEKQIPSSIFESNEADTALFLKHLWATDGNISIKNLKGRMPSAAIYYASSSRKLAKQTQHLLLTLGIQSTVSTVPSNRGYRDMYHVNIQGSTNQKQFLEKVGCSGKRGTIIPQLLDQIKEIKPHHNYDVIPKEAWQTVIKKAKNDLKLGWRDVCKGINTSYCGSTLFEAGISRTRMQTLHQVLPTKEIETLATSDIYWDEIISITKLSVEDVYDATVENVHNFVANDIVVHNSIEQDSDLVMFLLRREYYDPYDKPGTAELIVAKNRHGAIGNINFAFRKEIAQFANLSSVRSGGAPDNDEAFSAFNPTK